MYLLGQPVELEEGLKNWCFRVWLFICDLQMNHLAKILQPFDTVSVLQDMHIVLKEYYDIK